MFLNNCLRRSIFLQIWKHANVVPVHKKNEQKVKMKYRQSSPLSVFGKILETLVYNSLYSYVVSYELLNLNHSELGPGDSTVNQIHNAYDL